MHSMQGFKMRERMTSLARSLRRRETNSEEKLWLALRNRKLDGWKFRRQVPRGPYIVDFLCADASLVIEIDGIQHDESGNRIRDERRSAYLRTGGLRVLRFSNSDVLENLEGVLDEIYVALGKTSAPQPVRTRREDPTSAAPMRAETGAKDSAP